MNSRASVVWRVFKAFWFCIIGLWERNICNKHTHCIETGWEFGGIYIHNHMFFTVCIVFYGENTWADLPSVSETHIWSFYFLIFQAFQFRQNVQVSCKWEYQMIKCWASIYSESMHFWVFIVLPTHLLYYIYYVLHNTNMLAVGQPF